MRDTPGPRGNGDRASAQSPLRLRYRFGKSSRLADSADFDAAFREGRRRVGRFMVVWVRPNGRGQWRLGVVVSRRTLRRAVDRFRAKRLLREAFRLGQHDLPGCRDVVAVARRPIAQASCDDVRAELLRLLNGRPNRG
jgi:ribonuclease P protein component